ncbi:MAG TPA: DinB family protein [Acidimicrobiales bacterium]|nr:DinB family protein [Acidimicrobiales bacterium]
MGVKSDLVDLSDFAWTRLRKRLEGLTDEEYLWEPAPGCWTIRQRPDGRWRADWPLPSPEPAPFTTIAWRLWHLIDMYGEDRAPQWLDIAPQGPAIGFDDPSGEPPATAAGALEMLEAAHARWDRHLAVAPEERLQEKVGAVAGPGYADRTRAAYVLHMLDEFIHHGAEVGLLRDLWQWQHTTVADDPVVERVIRGDAAVVDELQADPAMRDQAVHAHPDLATTAAAYGRWGLVVDLARLGFPISGPGRTPLHLVAGAGELDVVQALVELGADVDATDPDFNATPIQWAQFLNRSDVVEWLSALGPGQPTKD